jgi:predicted lipoprotein with Yx(FWY)xxD motif
MRSRWIGVFPLVVIVGGAGAGAALAMSTSTHANAPSQAKTATVDTVKKSKFGTVLIGANGHTLYRFTTDSKNHARCTGSCAVYWKPLLVSAGTTPTAGSGVSTRLLGTIKSAHGMDQITYAGFPLYNYFEDTSADQFNGEGKSNAQNGIKPAGLWYVVSTRGALVKTGVTTGTGTSTGGGYGGGGY